MADKTYQIPVDDIGGDTLLIAQTSCRFIAVKEQAPGGSSDWVIKRPVTAQGIQVLAGLKHVFKPEGSRPYFYVGEVIAGLSTPLGSGASIIMAVSEDGDFA